MSMIRRMITKITFSCGIVGSVWTILCTTLIISFIPGQGEVIVIEITEGQTVRQVSSAIVSTMNIGDLTLLVLAGLSLVMGVLALVAVLSLKKRPYLRNALMWFSTSVILVVGLFGIGILLPAAILLVIAAIGMREGSEVPGEIAAIEG